MEADKTKYLKNGENIYPYTEATWFIRRLIKLEIIGIMISVIAYGVVVVFLIGVRFLLGLIFGLIGSLLSTVATVLSSMTEPHATVSGWESSVSGTGQGVTDWLTGVLDFLKEINLMLLIQALVLAFVGLVIGYLVTLAMRRHHNELRPFRDDRLARKIKKNLVKSYGFQDKEDDDDGDDKKYKSKVDKHEVLAQKAFNDMKVRVNTRKEVNGDEFKTEVKVSFKTPEKKKAKDNFNRILSGVSKELNDATGGEYVFGSVLKSKDGMKQYFIAEKDCTEHYLPIIEKSIEKAKQKAGLGESKEETTKEEKKKVAKLNQTYTEKSSTWPLSLLDDRTEQIKEQTVAAEREMETLKDKVELFMQSNEDLRSQLNDVVLTKSTVRFRYKIPSNKKITDGTLIKDLENFIGISGIMIFPKAGEIHIDVPLTNRVMADAKEIIYQGFEGKKLAPLTTILGIDVNDKPYIKDLATAPHLKMAGTTGSGKSVGLNQILTLIEKHSTPDEVRFMIGDPKFVEFSGYKNNPFLLADPILSPKAIAKAVQWLVIEQNRRYAEMAKYGVRNIVSYNKKRQEEGKSLMFYILLVIDEVGDIMMNKEFAGLVNNGIVKLGQKARAAGIDVIMATQSPRVDIISGLIKANTPASVSYSVVNYIESRVILDESGAEKLRGQGDSLIKWPGSNTLDRVQSLYFSDEEIERINQYLIDNLPPTEKVDFEYEVDNYDGRYETGEESGETLSSPTPSETRQSRIEDMADRKARIEELKKRRQLQSNSEFAKSGEESQSISDFLDSFKNSPEANRKTKIEAEKFQDDMPSIVNLGGVEISLRSRHAKSATLKSKLAYKRRLTDEDLVELRKEQEQAPIQARVSPIPTTPDIPRQEEKTKAVSRSVKTNNQPQKRMVRITRPKR